MLSNMIYLHIIWGKFEIEQHHDKQGIRILRPSSRHCRNGGA